MTAEEFLEIYLGGNMNVSTLTPLAISEFAEAYAKLKAREYTAAMADNLSEEFDNIIDMVKDQK